MTEQAPLLYSWFPKTTESIPSRNLEACIIRFSDHDESLEDGEQKSGVKRKLPDSQEPDDTRMKSYLNKAVRTFLENGYCIVSNALPVGFVSDCRKKASTDLTLLHEALEERRQSAGTDHHLLAAAHRIDYEELVARDGGRHDVRFDLYRYPFAASGLSYNGLVMPLVRELLGGGEVSLLYEGVMWALPEPGEVVHQKWHADGGHLFQHAQQPPHCINVFYPLVDLNEELGPTEVKPGSHILRAQTTDGSTVSLVAKAGDAIIFDYRLQHRGRSNVSKGEPRPILYLAYAKPWFKDAGNRRSAQSIFQGNDGRKERPWTTRLLTGEPLPVGEGFEGELPGKSTTDPTGTAVSSGGNTHGLSGSGEQWILFKLNVQIGEDGKEAQIIIYAGDVASEKATQFCMEHGLSKDFIPVLADTIQQQMDARQSGLDS